jgi:oligo-1,6-glucosidase
MTEQTWWKNAVAYQIYPRSFQDTNGDGFGDVQGIISRLDYLAELGVDVLWLSPIYKSPQDDNGYDISDYRDIDPLFGTLADVDELIAEAKARNIRIVMDLVVNHSSDEHAWFEESASSKDNPKADWYVWRDAKPDGSLPNNWGSFFSGPAWQWHPVRQQYFLHLFSKKQPDLNWENPDVRFAVYEMMNWWLDKGIAGFRMDVITFISKQPGYPDGPQNPGDEFGNGYLMSVNGPRLVEFLQEMHREVFANRSGTMTVGECPGFTTELALEVTNPANKMLDMGFHFDHMGVDQDGSKWNRIPFDLVKLKQILNHWQLGLGTVGWNSLYWDNHDQPRVLSRFGNDGEYRVESAKALATVLHMHRGTPYIYQGEELGMTNYPFKDISEFEDLETINHFETVTASGGDTEAALAGYRFFGRDNARTPVQWDASQHAGFTNGTPWLAVNPNFTEINAASQIKDEDSVFNHYKHLIALRHSDEVVALGDFEMLDLEDPNIYTIVRRHNDSGLIMLANLSDDCNMVNVPVEILNKQPMLISQNLQDAAGLAESMELRPWEAVVYRW